MKLFDKEKHTKSLREYYVNNYGENENDIWFEQPAVNVLVFKRGDNYITLKSDILTYHVTESVD